MGNILTWRKDLNKIEEIRRGTMRLKQRERERLNRKYNLEEKGTLYVTTMLKQKIRIGGRKIKRYDEKCLQLHTYILLLMLPKKGFSAQYNTITNTDLNLN